MLLFGRKEKKSAAREIPLPEENPSRGLDEMDKMIADKRRAFSEYRDKHAKPVTLAEEAALNPQGPSIIDLLPWMEYLPSHECMILADGRSVGAVFEVKPYGTEARSVEQLEKISEIVMGALQDSFEERDHNPWVVQFFCQDEVDFSDYLDELEAYIKPDIRQTAYSQEWLRIMRQHFHGLSRQEGLFFDDAVTKQPWRGQIRRARMVIYRYRSRKEESHEISAVEELTTTCERVVGALKGAGINAIRQNREQVYQWLLRWFNPAPDFDMPLNEIYRKMHWPTEKPGQCPVFVEDFSEMLFNEPPRSDAKQGFWYFNQKPHSVLVVDKLRHAPEVGHITGETKKADSTHALFDAFPNGTIMNLTIVVYPQDLLEQHILAIAKKSLGENMESIQTQQDCATTMSLLAEGHKMYRSSLCFFLRADTDKELKKQMRDMRNILLNAKFEPVREGFEVAPLSSYLRWMPMNYDPSTDKRHLYTKFNFVEHLSALAPVFGRSSGTGHPGINYFNRGGGTLTFDPLNKNDRSQNAHMLLLGPTGAGKSATLNAKIAQLMAVHRPRLFIVEAGNSFGLMMDYLEKHGLSVHRVSLKPGSGVVLPLFSEAHRLLDDEAELERKLASSEDDDRNEENEQRDLLGEMETSARLMITGGELKEDEALTRADRSMIRQAIYDAAKISRNAGRMTLTEDVRDALFALSQNETIPEKRREKAYSMAESINLFCHGFDGELFNREGELWPEVDVVHVDLAYFARDGYEAQLAISYLSLINVINNQGEAHQYDKNSRPIVNITDESHIITKNAILASGLTKGSKMWRKLGIWLWLATQNMEDFPDASERLLSMIEWWELLVPPPSEIKAIGRFKALTDEQTAMMLSTRKAPGKFTEGVIFSGKVEALFRVIPPSLYLALAMTEQHEKAERAQLMDEFGISELEAAFKIAEKLDKLRGILPEAL